MWSEMRSRALRSVLAVGVALALGAVLSAGCAPARPAPQPVPESPAAGENPDATVPAPPQAAPEDPPEEDTPEVPRVSAEEVKQKLDSGANVVVLDSRSADAYHLAHIPGAVSFPLTEMAGPFDGLQGYDEIITYCT